MDFSFKKTGMIIVALIFLIFNSFIFAEPSNSLTVKDAMIELDNNPTLQKLGLMVEKAKLQQTDALIASNSAKATFSFFDDMSAYGFSLGTYDKLQLTLMRDFMPDQGKYGYETTKANAELTENSLTLALRDIYLGLYNTYADVKINEKKEKLAQLKYEQSKSKYDKGMISQLDFEDVKYQYHQASQLLVEASRSFENLSRTFNTFVGKDVNITYDQVFKDIFNYHEVNDLDYYVNAGMKNRFEIVDIQNQIDLMEKKMEIYERGNFLNHHKAKDEYKEIEKEYETLKLQLEINKQNVKSDINKLYLEVKKARKQIDSIYRIHEIQMKRLEELKSQQSKGYLTEANVKEMEIAIQELEKQKDLVVFQYNTSLVKLKFASDIGPGLNGGMSNEGK